MIRNLLQKVKPFLRGIEQYGKAFDVLSNVNPEVFKSAMGRRSHYPTCLLRLLPCSVSNVLSHTCS